jgi:hypothetical protein
MQRTQTLVLKSKQGERPARVQKNERIGSSKPNPFFFSKESIPAKAVMV